MRNGFTFKGKHTSEFGVTVATQSRPIAPSAKEQSYEAALMDGEYDFSDANMYGRQFYNNREFKYDIKVIADDLRTLQRKLSQLAAWFCGKGELIFDDTPFVRWNARVTDLIDYRPEHGHTAVLSVVFKVKPFAEALFNVEDGPTLDSDITLDSYMPLDISAYFIFATAGKHTVHNIGDAAVRPVITVSDTSTNVKLTCNGASIIVSGACVIDCDKQTVTDGSGNSIMDNVSGAFFELVPGANTLTIVGNATIAVAYTARYLYDVDYDEVIIDDDE